METINFERRSIMSPNYSERPPTDEELQRLAHLSDICFKGFGIRLLSASGPPGTFAVGEDGDEVQLANRFSGHPMYPFHPGKGRHSVA